MLTFSIYKNILDYDINLKSINVKNNVEKNANKLRVGIRSKFLNYDEVGKKLIVPFSLDIVALKDEKDTKTDEETKEKIDKLCNGEDEEFEFKINIVFEVHLLFDNELSDSDKKSMYLKDYVYSLLEPSLKEIVSYMGNKVGIAGLKLPCKKLTFNERNMEDGNNN